MDETELVVTGVVPTPGDSTNLRDEVWDFVLDQRAFGPRRLLVAFADACGTFRGMAVTERIQRPELALGPCVEHLGRGSAAAVALCDEPVADGPPPPDLTTRFALAREVIKPYGVHLVDWFACDDQCFRSTRFALGATVEEWWDV